MSPLVWTGIAIAAFLALVALWAWLWRTPRIRAVYRHGGWWTREWRRPYVRIVRPADRRFGFALNQYVEHIVIGVALYVGHRGLSLVWARPRFAPDRSFDDHTDQGPRRHRRAHEPHAAAGRRRG